MLIAAISDMGTTMVECLKFFIYLTHWGFILCTIQAILGAAVVSRKYCELERLSNGECTIDLIIYSRATYLDAAGDSLTNGFYNDQMKSDLVAC